LKNREAATVCKKTFIYSSRQAHLGTCGVKYKPSFSQIPAQNISMVKNANE